MNGKKFLVIGLLSLFIISMFAGIVAAPNVSMNATTAGETLGKETRAVGEGVSAFFKALFGGVAVGKGEWLSKIFFGILLGMIIYTSINSFFGSGNELMIKGISIVATVIGMIAIPNEYLTALRTSYGAAGLTILAVIPFLVILAFTVKVKSLSIARGTWAVFIIYYFWMYIGILINPEVGSEVVSRAPYWIAILVGLAMFFFIGFIRVKMFKESLASDVDQVRKNIELSRARKELAEESRAAEAGI